MKDKGIAENPCAESVCSKLSVHNYEFSFFDPPETHNDKLC